MFTELYILDPRENAGTAVTAICGNFEYLDVNLTNLETTVSANSGKWESVYSTVWTNSADWGTSSYMACSVYLTVCALSAGWSSDLCETTYNTVQDLSAGWQSTYITTSSLSGYWHEKDHSHKRNINPVVGEFDDNQAPIAVDFAYSARFPYCPTTVFKDKYGKENVYITTNLTNLHENVNVYRWSRTFNPSTTGGDEFKVDTNKVLLNDGWSDKIYRIHDIDYNSVFFETTGYNYYVVKTDGESNSMLWDNDYSLNITNMLCATDVSDQYYSAFFDKFKIYTVNDNDYLLHVWTERSINESIQNITTNVKLSTVDWFYNKYILSASTFFTEEMSARFFNPVDGIYLNDSYSNVTSDNISPSSIVIGEMPNVNIKGRLYGIDWSTKSITPSASYEFCDFVYDLPMESTTTSSSGKLAWYGPIKTYTNSGAYYFWTPAAAGPAVYYNSDDEQLYICARFGIYRYWSATGALATGVASMVNLKYNFPLPDIVADPSTNITLSLPFSSFTPIVDISSDSNYSTDGITGGSDGYSLITLGYDPVNRFVYSGNAYPGQMTSWNANRTPAANFNTCFDATTNLRFIVKDSSYWGKQIQPPVLIMDDVVLLFSQSYKNNPSYVINNQGSLYYTKAFTVSTADTSLWEDYYSEKQKIKLLTTTAKEVSADIEIDFFDGGGDGQRSYTHNVRGITTTRRQNGNVEYYWCESPGEPIYQIILRPETTGTQSWISAYDTGLILPEPPSWFVTEPLKVIRDSGYNLSGIAVWGNNRQKGAWGWDIDNDMIYYTGQDFSISANNNPASSINWVDMNFDTVLSAMPISAFLGYPQIARLESPWQPTSSFYTISCIPARKAADLWIDATSTNRYPDWIVNRTGFVSNSGNFYFGVDEFSNGLARRLYSINSNSNILSSTSYINIQSGQYPQTISYNNNFGYMINIGSNGRFADDEQGKDCSWVVNAQQMSRQYPVSTEPVSGFDNEEYSFFWGRTGTTQTTAIIGYGDVAGGINFSDSTSRVKGIDYHYTYITIEPNKGFDVEVSEFNATLGGWYHEGLYSEPEIFTVEANNTYYVYLTAQDVPASDSFSYESGEAGIMITTDAGIGLLPDTFNRVLLTTFETNDEGVVPGSQILYSVSYPAFHSISDHSDTIATGDQLNTLVGGDNADALHTHSMVLCSTQVPAASGSSLTTTNGTLTWDSNYLYIKLNDNYWKRIEFAPDF